MVNFVHGPLRHFFMEQFMVLLIKNLSAFVDEITYIYSSCTFTYLFHIIWFLGREVLSPPYYFLLYNPPLPCLTIYIIQPINYNLLKIMVLIIEGKPGKRCTRVQGVIGNPICLKHQLKLAAVRRFEIFLMPIFIQPFATCSE